MRKLLSVAASGAGSLLRRFGRDASGATAIEYGLIATGIGIFVIAGISAIGSGLDGIFVNIASLF